MRGLGALSRKLRTLEGIELIQQDVRNLLFTRRGDRPMRAGLGIGLQSYLFEQADSASLQIMRSEIKEQLEIFEPRIEVVAVDVEFDELDSNVPRALITITARLASEPTLVESFRFPVEGSGGVG